MQFLVYPSQKQSPIAISVREPQSGLPSGTSKVLENRRAALC
jgi:hypothetical protein